MNVYGEYGQDEPGTIKICHGYSKDHRPDLKQFGIGLLCTTDGLPRLASIHNGNLDDKTWNHKTLDTLTQYLSPSELAQLLYVADSALVTYENLRKIEAMQMRFLSRLPETFHAASELKEAA